MALAAAGLMGLAGWIAGAGGPALRRWRAQRRRPDEEAAAEFPPTAGANEAAASEAEERERAVLDLLASGDPARLVVFTLRRARGYAEQARRRLAEADDSPGTASTVRPARTAELDRLSRALHRFRVSGIPADDLIAVRRLERWAASLAAASTDPSASDTPG